MPYPRPYRAGAIEPVVEVGQNLLLVGVKTYRLYKIAFIEPIPRSHPLVANIGALVAGATSVDFSTTAILDMAYGQLGQFRAEVLDDIHVSLLEPQQLARFGLNNVNARINAFSALSDPCGHMTETFILERDRIFLRAVNPTGYNLAQARVAFWGYKYVLYGGLAGGSVSSGEHMPPLAIYTSIQEALDKSGEKFTVIPIGGWTS